MSENAMSKITVLLVDDDTLRLRSTSRDWFRHVVDALELVGTRIPSDQLGCDLGAESHVDDPDDAIFVRSKAEDIVEVVVGPFPRRVPIGIRKWLERR